MKTDREKAIEEADEILEQLAWLGGIALAVIPTVLRIVRLL